jgi:hypothetical protein
MPLLEVQNLKVHFPAKHGVFNRVRATRRLTCERNCV